jgi:hypothetical protein
MGSAEQVAPDGSWKVVVEAWSFSLILYAAIGVTTRVYTRRGQNWWERLWNMPAGWDGATADLVIAAGSMASHNLPTVSAALPGSPNIRRNDASADCRAWTFGGSVRLGSSGTGLGGSGLSGEGVSSLNPIADMIRGGTGSATRNGLTLSAGPANYP